MAKRDIQSQYRQSFLGFFWAIAPIVTNSLVWIFLSSSGTVNVNTGVEIPYILFVVIGTTLWSIFTESIFIPINSVNSSKGIISKINFPKEALLISGFYKMFFNLGLKFIFIIAILIIYGISPTFEMLYFPIYVMVIILFAFVIGLLFTPIGVIYSDISRIISTVVPFIMYVTPVVYAKPPSGFMNTLMTYNPLAYWMSDLKNCLTGNGIEHPIFWIIFSTITLLLSVLTLVVYRISIPIITERMSA